MDKEGVVSHGTQPLSIHAHICVLQILFDRESRY
jgi:hypothetical protein